MKKECAYTQDMLPRYLKGHLFRPQQNRVERHLSACAVCRSRRDALRQADETREFLRYLDPEAGFPGRLQAAMAGITKLFFRPLWMLAIIGAVIAIRHYVIAPLLHDPDLEKLDAGGQHQSAVPAAEPQSAPTPTAPAAPAVQQPVSPSPAADPLVVVIAVEKEQEKASIARINEAMKEHALLKSLRFSDKVREISGSLTPDELTTFFSRIHGTGKITYKRSRLAAAGGEVLPFIMKLQTLSAPPRAAADKPAAGQAATKQADAPAEKPAGQADERAAERPAQAPAPAAPAPQAQ